MENSIDGAPEICYTGKKGGIIMNQKPETAAEVNRTADETMQEAEDAEVLRISEVLLQRNAAVYEELAK